MVARVVVRTESKTGAEAWSIRREEKVKALR